MKYIYNLTLFIVSLALYANCVQASSCLHDLDDEVMATHVINTEDGTLRLTEANGVYTLTSFKLKPESQTAIEINNNFTIYEKVDEIDPTQRKKVASFIKDDLPKGTYVLTEMLPEDLQHSSLESTKSHFVCMILDKLEGPEHKKIVNLRVSFEKDSPNLELYVEYPHAHNRGYADDLTPSSTGGYSYLFKVKKN